jgi:hypothetical protein
VSDGDNTFDFRVTVHGCNAAECAQIFFVTMRPDSQNLLGNKSPKFSSAEVVNPEDLLAQLSAPKTICENYL